MPVLRRLQFPPRNSYCAGRQRCRLWRRRPWRRIRVVSNTFTSRFGGFGWFGSGRIGSSAGRSTLAVPTGGPSTVAVTTINGTAINANPFSFRDITINTGSPVPIVISGVYVPPGTTGNLYVFGETTADQAIPFTLTGTVQSSTATVNVSYPAVAPAEFAKVTWTGQ